MDADIQFKPINFVSIHQQWKKNKGPNQPLLVFFFFESNFTNVTNRANFHFLSYCMQTNKQTILSTVTFFLCVANSVCRLFFCFSLATESDRCDFDVIDQIDFKNKSVSCVYGDIWQKLTTTTTTITMKKNEKFRYKIEIGCKSLKKNHHRFVLCCLFACSSYSNSSSSCLTYFIHSFMFQAFCFCFSFVHKNVLIIKSIIFFHFKKISFFRYHFQHLTVFVSQIIL